MKSINKTVQITDVDQKNLAQDLLVSKDSHTFRMVFGALILWMIPSIINEWVDIRNIASVIFLSGLLLMQPIIYVINFKIYKRDSSSIEVYYEINEEYVKFTTSTMENMEIAWKDVTSINKLNRNIIIANKKNINLYLPKSCFTKEEFDTIEEIIKSKISYKKIHNNRR